MKTVYATQALAVGAWVAGEMAAAMKNPGAMLDEDGAKGNGDTVFCGVGFMQHIDGMLDDLIDICSLEMSNPDAPCALVIEQEQTPGHEWQWCLQGYARIEQA